MLLVCQQPLPLSSKNSFVPKPHLPWLTDIGSYLDFFIICFGSKCLISPWEEYYIDQYIMKFYKIALQRKRPSLEFVPLFQREDQIDHVLAHFHLLDFRRVVWTAKFCQNQGVPHLSPSDHICIQIEILLWRNQLLIKLNSINAIHAALEHMLFFGDQPVPIQSIYFALLHIF